VLLAASLLNDLFPAKKKDAYYFVAANMMRNAMSTLNQKFISEYRTNLCVKIERVWSGESRHILPVAV